MVCAKFIRAQLLPFPVVNSLCLVPFICLNATSGALSLTPFQLTTSSHQRFFRFSTRISTAGSGTFETTSSTTMTNPFKKAKLAFTPSQKVIGTHSGTFQADEALGVWLLRQTETFFNAKVVRSRDNDVLKDLDIVIDVGGIYNHDALRYDHHQRDFDETFSDEHTVTKLSASGLVYKHYGKQIIRAHYPHLSEEHLDLAYQKMYKSFMEAIDAIDTGVEISPNPLYKDATGLSARVGRLNTRWNDDKDNTPSQDERFEVASTLCGKDFMDVLSPLVESSIPAYKFVEEAVLDRTNVDSSGEVIKLPSGGMPWKSHLYDLERKHGVSTLIKFVLYTDESGMWRIQAVSEEDAGFTNRLGLPEEWRGVRDEELEAIAKIPGCTFCHKAGFIGGNKTFEGALAMAKAALSAR